MLNVLLIANEVGHAGHIAATISKSKLIDFVEDKGYEAVEFQNEDYDDETSISAVANQVLEEKQNRLALEGLAKEIDKKWGRGTWNQILQQRKRLLAEKAAAEQLAKENALKKKKADKIFWHNFWVEAGKVVLIILFAGIMIGFVYWAATAPKIR